MFDNINFINLEFFFNQAQDLAAQAVAVLLNAPVTPFLWLQAFLFILSALMVIGGIYALYRRFVLLENNYKVFFESFSQNDVANQESEFDLKWNDILGHLDNSSMSSWSLAIIEADKLLDQALEGSGFAGESLGDKLKAAENGGLISLSDAWTAHKLRNRIAHEDNFSMSHHEAREAIRLYQRVLIELGYLSQTTQKIEH